MNQQLTLRFGQYSSAGRKASNQDFHGALVPLQPQLTSKGAAFAIADGISSSEVSHIASQSAVAGFLQDYFCTSETWSVKQSAQRVISAINSWLHAQSRQGQFRYAIDRGYVCTFSTLIIKAASAHLFHIGDGRIHRLSGGHLEQLTQDHRMHVSAEQHYLSRALGIHDHVEIDYQCLPVEAGDVFVLTTDGIHEFIDESVMARCIQDCQDDLTLAARAITEIALNHGSDDNLTIQIVRVEQLPEPSATELYQRLNQLPFPPELRLRAEFDGFTIQRELHHSSRSHLYLAIDNASGERVVIKTPSHDLRHDEAYIERLLMEEWIARRINNPHVLRAWPMERPRHFLYLTSEYLPGQTLEQWMRDHPTADLTAVRSIVGQIARGLRAFHRLEMLHQDLRPANVMIDEHGTVTLIDFGSTRVAGVAELSDRTQAEPILGTLPYTAPEYFSGDPVGEQADLFSLAVMTYQMLSGHLPYGTQVATARSRAAQARLHYESVFSHRRDIPLWVDEALKKALQPQPSRRYDAISEFVHDLNQPNPRFIAEHRPPLLERNPLLFWQGLSCLLALLLIWQLVKH